MNTPTKPAASRLPVVANTDRRVEALRGRCAQLEQVARISDGAHRLAYGAVMLRDVVLQRVRDAKSMEEVAEALDSLVEDWSDEALPVDEATQAALAEHLWQQCQRHTAAGALYEDPRRVAHYAVDFLRAMWRMPAPAATQESTGEQPVTDAEPAAGEDVTALEEEHPDTSDEEQQCETRTAPHAWGDKWRGQREALRAQLDAGITPDPEFVGRVVCPEGAACPRGPVATFKPRADGSVPMHRYDVGGEACAGVGVKREPLRLATEGEAGSESEGGEPS